jgi:hypothetical protein
MLATHLIMRTIFRPVGFAAAVFLFFFSLAREDPSHAQVVPSGWAALGQVRLEKNACSSCPATFPTVNRHRNIGLSSDSPYPVSLSGRVDIKCADGTSYNVLLRSAARGGLFQVIRNSCVNLDAKEVGLTITSVSLSPPDADRTVTLSVYGSLG